MNHLNGVTPSHRQDDLVSFNISSNFLESGILPAPAVASMTARISAGGAPVPIWLIALVSVASLLGIHVFRNWLSDEEDDYAGAGLQSEPADAEDRQKSYQLFISGPVSMTAARFIRLPRERIGNGMVGSTYKIGFPTGMEVAAKSLRVGGGPSMEEFCRKVQQLSQLEHENLGRIIGCYCSQDIDQRIFISEHVDGQSLFHLLHDRQKWGGGGVLNSTNRLMIAKGIVRGLAHLHRSLAGEIVPHGNLKSSNVIIPSGHSMNPRLVNFGLIPLLPLRELPRLAVGFTPEFTSGKLPLPEMSPKTDIYCLGILLLELVTGMNPRGGEKELVNWVGDRMLLGKDYVLDFMISDEIDNHGIMCKILEIALECAALSPEKRPEMSQLLGRIEAI